MIRFPETVQAEIDIIHEAATAEQELRKRIERATLVERKTEDMRVQHEARIRLQQEIDADLTPLLEMGTLASYNANPTAAPSDLIEGVLKDNDVCIMIGPAGSGKSTSALQMVHSLMTGDDWLGQTVNTKVDAVGILSYDMDASMMFNWMSGYPNMDPNKISIVNAYKRGNPLGVPEMRAQIAAAWKKMNVGLVVLDSFTASFFGESENDSTMVQHHYRDMIKFALTEVGARSVVIIAHTSDSSPHKIRGSSAHHAVAGSIISQVSDSATQQRSVRMVKYRTHHTPSGSMTTQMTPVMITAPDSVTNLVDLDVGAMTLAGMQVPVSAGASAFPTLPSAHDAPDTDSNSGMEEDEL